MVESRDLALREGGRRARYEARRLCRDGSYRWTRWDAIPDPDSELLYGVGVDVSDEKPVERTHVVVGAWTHDDDAGTSIWSQEMFAIFGLRGEGTVPHDAIDSRIHPQDRPLIAARRASMTDDDGHAGCAASGGSSTATTAAPGSFAASHST